MLQNRLREINRFNFFILFSSFLCQSFSFFVHIFIFLSDSSVVIDAPFQTKSGVQIGVQAMTSCVTIIYAYLKKRNTFVLFRDYVV